MAGDFFSKYRSLLFDALMKCVSSAFLNLLPNFEHLAIQEDKRHYTLKRISIRNKLPVQLTIL